MKRGLILGGAATVAGIASAILLAALLTPGPAPPAAGSAGGTAPAPGGPAPVAPALAGADAGRGASVFGVCSACHTVGREGPDVDGPNLYSVVDSRVAGRRPRYGYTQALRDAGGVWTPDRLNAWLTDPAAFAPGTAMHFAGLPDARDRADVIAFLESQGPTRR